MFKACIIIPKIKNPLYRALEVQGSIDHIIPRHVHTYLLTCLYTYLLTCTYLHTYIHIYTYIHMYMQTYMHAHTYKHAYMHAHLLRKFFEESNVQTFQRLRKQSDRAAQVHVSIADVHPENSFFRKMAYKPCLDFRFVSTQYFGRFCFVNKTYFDQTCIQPFKTL